MLLYIGIGLAIAAAVYWFVIRPKMSSSSAAPPVTPGNPWTIGPFVPGVGSMSPGMPAQPTANGDGSYSFDFPQAAPGVHGMTRPWGPVAGGTISMTYQIDGSPDFIEVDSSGAPPGPGKVRLFLQRRGDDWSGVGDKEGYRFYSAPQVLAPGEHTLSVPLTPENWSDVYPNDGDDAAAFPGCLADLATVGMGFGGMFAMHGAYATGPAKFTVKSFGLS